jgi:hypothetical protein
MAKQKHKRLAMENGADSAKCKVQSAKCKVQSAKCKVQSAKCKVQSAKCKVQSGNRWNDRPSDAQVGAPLQLLQKVVRAALPPLPAVVVIQDMARTDAAKLAGGPTSRKHESGLPLFLRT